MECNALVNANQTPGRLAWIRLGPLDPELPLGDTGKAAGPVGEGELRGGARAGAFVFSGVAHGKRERK